MNFILGGVYFYKNAKFANLHLTPFRPAILGFPSTSGRPKIKELYGQKILFLEFNYYGGFLMQIIKNPIFSKTPPPILGIVGPQANPRSKSCLT
jgi:hypothetical protein